MDNEEGELKRAYSAINTSLSNYKGNKREIDDAQTEIKEKLSNEISKQIINVGKVIEKSEMDLEERRKALDYLRDLIGEVRRYPIATADKFIGFIGWHSPKISNSKEDKEAVKKATEKEKTKPKEKRSYTKGDD